MSGSGLSWNHNPSNWWDVSINRVWGCDPISPACDHCYAMAFDRYAGGALAGVLAGEPGSRKGEVHFGPGNPRLYIPSFGEKCRRLNVQAERLGIRYRVFPNSMSDWLDPKWDPLVLADFIVTMADCKAIDFLTCTKRPGLFRKRVEAAWKAARDAGDAESAKKIAWWLLEGKKARNVWAGATVEDQKRGDERIEDLLKIGAGVHWLSMEPLLSEVNLTMVGRREGEEFNCLGEGKIDWVVIGGESGSRKTARPTDPEWIFSAVRQCRDAGVPVWFKQWGEWVGGELHKSKGKVMLHDGGIFWTNPGHPKVHRWGAADGSPYFDRVSSLVGMKPRGVGRGRDDGGEGEQQSNNYLLHGKIVRELPAWLNRDGRAKVGPDVSIQAIREGGAA